VCVVADTGPYRLIMFHFSVYRRNTALIVIFKNEKVGQERVFTE
jgi:hypothetical protein